MRCFGCRRDSGAMLLSRCDERAGQIHGDVALGAGGGDRAAEYLAAGAANAVGCIVAFCGFLLFQDQEELMR